MNGMKLHLLHRPPASRRFLFLKAYATHRPRFLRLRMFYVIMSLLVGCTGLLWFLRLSSDF